MLCEHCGARPPCRDCVWGSHDTDHIRLAELERELLPLMYQEDFLLEDAWGFVVSETWFTTFQSTLCPLGLYVRAKLAAGPILPQLRERARQLPRTLPGRERALVCALLEISGPTLAGWLDGWRRGPWRGLLSAAGRHIYDVRHDEPDRWADTTAAPEAVRVAKDGALPLWDRAVVEGVYWGARARQMLPERVRLLNTPKTHGEMLTTLQDLLGDSNVPAQIDPPR